MLLPHYTTFGSGARLLVQSRPGYLMSRYNYLSYTPGPGGPAVPPVYPPTANPDAIPPGAAPGSPVL